MTRTSDRDDSTTVLPATAERLEAIHRWHLGLTVLHAAQAVGILMLAGDFAITVSASFPEGPPGTRRPPPEGLFDVQIGPAIALFLVLAAIDHFVTGSVARPAYEAGLRQGINRFRWIEYSFSATLMIVLIGFYSGITDITAVVAVAGANVGMILFGWLQEKMNPPGRADTTMVPFWFGALVGSAPWLALVINVVGAETVPGFVYGILVAQFLFFSSFAVNQWLHYRGVGPWRDYLYGEKAYLVLSLGAKSVLAWQIYGGSLS